MAGKKLLSSVPGPGGLTSAMLLAHRGFEVTVFEKEPVVGGRNAPIKLDGFTFDTGPTFLMMHFILKEMFAETGRRAEDYLEAKKIDPLYRLEEFDNCYLAGGGTHPGGGLPTIYESARISTNLLCEKHGVPYTPPGPLPVKEAFA